MAIFVKFKNKNSVYQKVQPREVMQLKERGEKFDIKVTGRSKNPLAKKKKKSNSNSLFDGFF